METTFQYKRAVPVWIGTEPGTYNHLVGFYGSFCVEKEEKITLYIAARSYYRVYVNQELLANGPARTAAGYCRVDRLAFTAKGLVPIAVEVLEADKPGKYSNDCTLEKGMLCLEAVDEAGNVLLADGAACRLCGKKRRSGVSRGSVSSGRNVCRRAAVASRKERTAGRDGHTVCGLVLVQRRLGAEAGQYSQQLSRR